MVKTFQNIPLDPEPLSALLSRVSLEGTIDQCVMTVCKGVASIHAVDMTNTVFASVSAKVSLPDLEIGLCGLSNIIRVLAQGGEFTLSIIGGGEGDTVAGSVVFKKKGLGTARFILMAPSDVPTSVPEEGASAKILAQCKTAFLLKRDSMDKVGFFTGIFPSEVIRAVGKSGSVTFSSAQTEANRFHTTAGAYKGGEFSTQVYCGMLLKALKVVFADSEVKETTILTGPSMPIIVQMDKGNFWAVTPIAS